MAHLKTLPVSAAGKDIYRCIDRAAFYMAKGYEDEP